MTEISVERLRPGDEEELLSFYRENLKDWPTFKELWQWRKSAPRGFGTETAVVARLDRAIVGSVGVADVAVSFAGRTFQASWQQDSLVASRMRGKGVGRALVEKAAEGWDLVMAKGTSPAMYALRKAARFSDVARSNSLVCVLKPRRRSGSAMRYIGEVALKLWHETAKMIHSKNSLDVQELHRFDSLSDDLALRLSAEDILRPLKDSAYLNWRYFQCPCRKYSVLGVSGWPSAVVLGTSVKTAGEGWIVDMVHDWGDSRMGEALLAEGMRWMEMRGVERLWAFATLPCARRSLIRLGFLPTPVTPHFTIRCGESCTLPVASSTDFWHGDGDVELYA